MNKPRSYSSVVVKMLMPPEMVKPFDDLIRAEGVNPRVIVERAVIRYIQSGCGSLIKRLAVKEEVKKNLTVKERTIQQAVRRALGEARGAPRIHPIKPEWQAEVDRRVEAHKVAHPPPIYQTLYENLPKAGPGHNQFDDFSEVGDE